MTNVDVAAPSTTYNSIAEYECILGYTLPDLYNGNQINSTCQADGMWSAVPAGCEREYTVDST